MTGFMSNTDIHERIRQMFDGEEPKNDEFFGPPETVAEVSSNTDRVAVVRTTDRIMFKRCRRRWGWQSHMRQNLGPKQNAAPLWLGSGFHFALEDFHGYNRFGHPKAAFDAYVMATKKKSSRLPEDWRELTELGQAMLEYYADDWLIGREPLETYWFNGKPQVEVSIKVDVPADPEMLKRYGIDRVVYSLTLDRVSIDEVGNLWIVEYKTAKQFGTTHFTVDPQVSAYCWAASHVYDRPVVGVIYQQHKKELPKFPEPMASGRLSVNKSQRTTHRLYRKALINQYGDIQRAPADNVNYLNWLAAQDSPDADMYIRRDRVERNVHSHQSEGTKILLELEDMLNPDLPLYPNPTRDCSFMCPFLSACVSIDDGSDWEYELQLMMETRDAEYDPWRRLLPKPQHLEGLTQRNLLDLSDQ